jgi:hypothetical protein
LARLHRAFGRRELAGDEFEQGRFASAIFSADAHAPPVFKLEVESSEQLPASEFHSHVR